VFGVSLFSMVAAFGTARDTRFEDIPRQEVVEQLALPALAPASEPEPKLPARRPGPARRHRHGTCCSDLGIDDPAAFGFLKGNATPRPVPPIEPGQEPHRPYRPPGRIASLVFPLNGGKDQGLVVERKGERFSASEQPWRLKPRS
jgi:hypothetical protein